MLKNKKNTNIDTEEKLIKLSKKVMRTFLIITLTMVLTTFLVSFVFNNSDKSTTDIFYHNLFSHIISLIMTFSLGVLIVRLSSILIRLSILKKAEELVDQSFIAFANAAEENIKKLDDFKK